MREKKAMNSIERGCFLIADVSGYTRYLGGVELDHAQDILADLLGAVVTSTSVMQTAKLEGDAVFCHAPTGHLDGPALVDTIESCYFDHLLVRCGASAPFSRATRKPSPEG